MIIGIDASRANVAKKTGVGWYAWHVIQELKKIMPEEIWVVLYTDKPLQGELAELPESWEERVLGWKPGRLWTQFRLSWEMLVHRPDVLWIPAHVFPIIHPKKTVMTLHDIAAVKFPESYNWFEKWYTLWSGRVALKKLWKVITISNFSKNEFKKEFGNVEKVKAIHLGYDKQYRIIEDKIKNESVLKKYNITKPYLMTIGRLEKKKNTVNIIKAFDKLREEERGKGEELQLLLIGKSGFGYEEVKQAIENSSYKNDIITPGWVENEDLPYLMSAAEVFVFPSLYEGFGIPILEAQACGTPVVCSRGSSLEEIGGDACVYVDPSKVDDIATGIEKVLQDKELRVQNIQRGLERVKEFSWGKCAKETLSLLLD